jgi:hypothetical protein
LPIVKAHWSQVGPGEAFTLQVDGLGKKSDKTITVKLCRRLAEPCTSKSDE